MENDLSKSLLYIKTKYGNNIFYDYTRWIDKLEDLSPKLKIHKKAIEIIGEEGIFEDFIITDEVGGDRIRRAIYRMIFNLIKIEKLSLEEVIYYTDVMKSVFQWNIPIDIKDVATRAYNTIKFLNETKEDVKIKPFK